MATLALIGKGPCSRPGNNPNTSTSGAVSKSLVTTVMAPPCLDGGMGQVPARDSVPAAFPWDSRVMPILLISMPVRAVFSSAVPSVRSEYVRN